MTRFAAPIALAALLTAPIGLFGALPADAAERDAFEQAKFEQDRAAILAMAGQFDVTFDFRETVALAPGYELREPKLTDAKEIVLVIEDDGDTIKMQHILLVGPPGKEFALKHWRQDWVYEPASIPAFEGLGEWEQKAVPAYEAMGAWAQIVWQVDDSPRYASVARWTHADGVSEWEAPEILRPRPRRETTTRPDYNLFAAVNRHAITPDGWVHEQENTKLIRHEDGTNTALAREIGINTYRNATLERADQVTQYWQDTADYWAAVRAYWDDRLAKEGKVALRDGADEEAMWDAMLKLAEQDDAIARFPDILDTYFEPVAGL